MLLMLGVIAAHPSQYWLRGNKHPHIYADSLPHFLFLAVDYEGQGRPSSLWIAGRRYDMFGCMAISAILLEGWSSGIKKRRIREGADCPSHLAVSDVVVAIVYTSGSIYLSIYFSIYLSIYLSLFYCHICNCVIHSPFLLLNPHTPLSPVTHHILIHTYIHPSIPINPYIYRMAGLAPSHENHRRYIMQGTFHHDKEIKVGK